MKVSPRDILVLGYSNLGADLFETAREAGVSVHLMSSKRHTATVGFEDYRDAKVIINTCGGGIYSAPDTLWELNIRINQKLIAENPDKPVLAFSSNAALEPWRSFYGATKRALEEMAWASENLFVFRVSSLYGKHKPQKCFPWKLKQNHPRPCEVSLPTNPIQPTPTAWLASRLVMGEFDTDLHVQDLAPCNYTSVLEWGKSILGENSYSYRPAVCDPHRNKFRTLQGEGNPSWAKLWTQYK